MPHTKYFSDPPLKYESLESYLAGYRGQFVLARDLSKLPRNWKAVTFAGWHLATNDLPVQTVRSEHGTEIGWCVGYPIGDWESAVVAGSTALDDFYQSTAGTFLLVLFDGEEGHVYLDPYGCLPAVYSADEQVVASTPTLIHGDAKWNMEVISALGFPETTAWFPFGMTARKGISRLIPNHRLNLGDWSLERHWPVSEGDVSVGGDVEMLVSRIRSNMAATLRRAAKDYPLTFTLTAGRDSRMILASAREVAGHANFFTLEHAGASRDAHIAPLLARKLGLKHQLMPVKNASHNQVIEWLYRTGHSIGGAIMNIHPTLEGLDRRRVLVQGIAGEVGRGRFWKKGDRDDKALTAESILQRLQVPDHPLLRSAADEWLLSLPKFGSFLKLDLLFIEQRLACWAACSRFGNTTSVFEFTPFNDRKVFSDMMRLPHRYRWDDRLPDDICRQSWPELLSLPFNRFTGFRGILDTLKGRGKDAVKSALYRGGL